MSGVLASLIQRTYSALCEGGSFSNAARAAGRAASAFFSSPGIAMSLKRASLANTYHNGAHDMRPTPTGMAT